mmetsp:Transcript_46212/g.116373  ORF Transcript_46212/g.116373 Transcript_46212/m.116373 type:complete len:259 (+) Transcript_46212:1151-1927(+)
MAVFPDWLGPMSDILTFRSSCLFSSRLVLLRPLSIQSRYMSTMSCIVNLTSPSVLMFTLQKKLASLAYSFRAFFFLAFLSFLSTVSSVTSVPSTTLNVFLASHFRNSWTASCLVTSWSGRTTRINTSDGTGSHRSFARSWKYSTSPPKSCTCTSTRWFCSISCTHVQCSSRRVEQYGTSYTLPSHAAVMAVLPVLDGPMSDSLSLDPFTDGGRSVGEGVFGPACEPVFPLGSSAIVVAFGFFGLSPLSWPRRPGESFS